MAIPAGPEDVFLALRGLRTMELRLREAERQGLALAHMAQRRGPRSCASSTPPCPIIRTIGIWKRDFSGSSGLFSRRAEAGLGRGGRRLARRARTVRPRLFLGRLREPRRSRSTARPTAPRPASAPGGPTIRFSVGLEDIEDLKADLDRGFARLRATACSEHGEVARPGGASMKQELLMPLRRLALHRSTESRSGGSSVTARSARRSFGKPFADATYLLGSRRSPCRASTTGRVPPVSSAARARSAGYAPNCHEPRGRASWPWSRQRQTRRFRSVAELRRTPAGAARASPSIFYHRRRRRHIRLDSRRLSGYWPSEAYIIRQGARHTLRTQSGG